MAMVAVVALVAVVKVLALVAVVTNAWTPDRLKYHCHYIDSCSKRIFLWICCHHTMSCCHFCCHHTMSCCHHTICCLLRPVATSACPSSPEIALDIPPPCHLATSLCSSQHDGHQSSLHLVASSAFSISAVRNPRPPFLFHLGISACPSPTEGAPCPPLPYHLAIFACSKWLYLMLP